MEPLSRGRHVVVTLIIALLSMIGPFTIDTIFPAFDLIGHDVTASTTQMQQVVSLYMVSFAVMSLVHGPLSDAIGRKPVMVVGLLAYVAASVLCALAPNLGLLLLGRALQGASAGAGQILSRTMIRDLYAGPAAQRMMAQVSMIFSVAPAVAPVVGGWLLGAGSWRLIFWGLAGLGAVLAAAVAFGLPETRPGERTSFELRGVLSSLRRVLSDVPFLKLAGASMFGFATQFIYIVSAPIIMLTLLHQGEQDFWKLFVPMVAGMMLGSLVSSRLSGRVPPERLASGVYVTLLVLSAVNVAIASTGAGARLPLALIAPPFIGLAWAVAFPVMQLQMLDRFPENRGAAASGQSFTMLLFNAALSGIIAPLVAVSMQGIAITSAALALLGSLCWFSYRRGAVRRART